MRLTIEAVQKAIDDLQSEGIKPTYQTIVERVGYGSYTTLKRLRNRHPDVFECFEKPKHQPSSRSVSERFEQLESRLVYLESLINNKPSVVDDNTTQWAFKFKELQTENGALESKLEAVQSEAQANINSLAQKLSEAKREIQRQSTEYNNLHQKYITLKADVFEGKVPAKSTTRNPLTLDGEVEVEYIIDTDKAKERVIELTKEGLDHKAITQQLESEGYRTKGLLGDVKPYLQSNIGKWQRKFKQNGHL
jgi:uncharacterized coiled-coil protein SlyX